MHDPIRAGDVHARAGVDRRRGRPRVRGGAVGAHRGERRAPAVPALEERSAVAPGLAWEELNPFMVNAAQIVKTWPELTPDDQRSFARDLADVQTMVRAHWDAGPAVER